MVKTSSWIEEIIMPNKKKSCGPNKHKMPSGKCMKGKTHAKAVRKKKRTGKY